MKPMPSTLTTATTVSDFSFSEGPKLDGEWDPYYPKEGKISISNGFEVSSGPFGKKSSERKTKTKPSNLDVVERRNSRDNSMDLYRNPSGERTNRRNPEDSFGRLPSTGGGQIDKTPG